MSSQPAQSTNVPLLGLGLIAFLIATLSIVDMYLPRPYDGVILEPDNPEQLLVRGVVRGSGAEQAGIRPGDRIVGIARSAIRSTGHAAALLNQNEIGSHVPYLVRSRGELREVEVELGRRRIGTTSYLYACILGFSFFFIGLFVLVSQPSMRASQLFFAVCILFLLFLVCRLRPASYSWVDVFVLNTGTAALLILPAVFLHFFLIFPHPFYAPAGGSTPRLFRKRGLWGALLALVYVAPIAVCIFEILRFHAADRPISLISGAPAANWWILAIFILLGLGALLVNARRLPPSKQRQGAVIVFIGAVLGLLPFIVLTIGFTAFLHTDKFVFYGIIPLVLVPLTFAYAIIRFQLLDVRLIIRKSLLYTLTTAIVTIFYAVAIASFNLLFRGTEIASSTYFPIVFALAIVLLFEPLRRRIQIPVDRFFYQRSSRLQAAILQMGESLTAELDPAAVVRELVEELPRNLELQFAALYLLRGNALERVAGPDFLPPQLPHLPQLSEYFRSQPTLVQLDGLGSLRVSSPAVDAVVDELERSGVEVIGDLTSSRRNLGVVLISGKKGKMPLEPDELRLLRGLFSQAAIALETSLLLDERARQAELEREMQIAAKIQSSLLPKELRLTDGWEVAAACQPARLVGGDFYAELPGASGNCHAVVYGDVSGKSVSGALMMMSAKEVLHSIAAVQHDPKELFGAANRRLYELWNRSFLAAGYFGVNGSGDTLHYVVAGQPQPLKRNRVGIIEELPLPAHRLPLGAMRHGEYELLSTKVEAGDMVIAYSDGVIEAQNPEGDFFGMERLTQAFHEAPTEPQAAVDYLLGKVVEFTRHNEQYDDITLLAIGRGERKPDA